MIFKNKLLYQISLVLLVIGGINWGFVGIFNVNIMSAILGAGMSRLIFFIIGLAAVFIVGNFYKTGGMDKFKKEAMDLKESYTSKSKDDSEQSAATKTDQYTSDVSDKPSSSTADHSKPADGGHGTGGQGDEGASSDEKK